VDALADLLAAECKKFARPVLREGRSFLRHYPYQGFSQYCSIRSGGLQCLAAVIYKAGIASTATERTASSALIKIGL
jgi:hypothetical protein